MSYTHRGPGNPWDRPHSKNPVDRGGKGQSYTWRQEDDRRWLRQTPWRPQDGQIPEEGEATTSESEGKGRWSRSTRVPPKAMPKRQTPSSSSRGSATAEVPDDETEFLFERSAPAEESKGRTKGKGYFRERDPTGSASRGKGSTCVRDPTGSATRRNAAPNPEPWVRSEFFPLEVPKEDILLYPPPEFSDISIVFNSEKLRNQTILEALTSRRFAENVQNAKSLKFLARIFLGLMTREEWIKYGLYYRYAAREFENQYQESPMVKLSRNVARLLRHTNLLIGGNEKNAVDIQEFEQSMSVFSYSRHMFKLAVCIAANNKQRFFAEVKASKEPDVLEIRIGAHQGHSLSSPLFDPSLTGTELRTWLTGNLKSLGVVYHLTPIVNKTSIQRMGLLADPDPNVQGRLAVHMLFHPKDQTLARAGTQYSSYEGKVSAFQFKIADFYKDDSTRQVLISENGVILFYGNIAPKYLAHIGDYTLEQRADLSNILEFFVTHDDDFDDTKDLVTAYHTMTSEQLCQEAGLSSNDTSLGFNPDPTEMTFEDINQSMRKELSCYATASEFNSDQTDMDINTAEAPTHSGILLQVNEMLGIEVNSCPEIFWDFLDQGYLYRREEHPDLGLKHRKIIESPDTLEYEIFYEEWKELSPDRRESLRNMGISSSTWKSTPLSGLAVHFLWSAWQAAKRAILWRYRPNETAEVQKMQYLNWKNTDWKGIGFEQYWEGEEGEQEFNRLNRDWRLILEIFCTFFDSVAVNYNPYECKFGTAVVNRILEFWTGDRPTHEWVSNILSSLRHYCDKAYRNGHPLHRDVTFNIDLDMDVTLRSSVEVEEMETTLNEVSQKVRTAPSTTEPSQEEEKTGCDTTVSEPVQKDDPGRDTTVSEPGAVISEEEGGDTPLVSDEERNRLIQLLSWVQFLKTEKQFEWPRDERSPLRLLDKIYGCTGQWLNESHAFELQETPCTLIPFSEHSHSHFVFDATNIFMTWDFIWTSEATKNDVFEPMDCRVITSSSAELTKQARQARDREVKRIIDEFYEKDYHPIERRREYIFRILEAAFKIRDVDFIKRAKGFNSTPNLNILVGNFGNFKRTSKNTHPRMSASQFNKATSSDDPSDNLLIRMLEGMSSHLVLLCESSEITDREFAYLEHQGRFSYAQSVDKNFTVLIRGENCSVKVLFDSCCSPYYQAYSHAMNEEIELPTMPNLVLPFAIFEVEFGTIGVGHQQRAVPSSKQDYEGDDLSMKAKRTRLFGSEVTTSVQIGSSSTEEVPVLSRANMYKCRVCVFHAQNKIVSESPARTAENFFFMWELCLRYQCDIVAGDANMAGYRMMGSKQLIPNHRTACFTSTLMYLIEKWNKASEEETGNNSRLIDVDFVSSNSVSTLYELMCFYNDDNRGHKLRTKEIDISFEDWPEQDCIHAAIFSYGHTFSDPEDFAELRRTDGSEFSITISENVSEIMHETLFLPHTDGDFHSPIWISLNLPETRHSGLRRSLRPGESRKRAHDTRKERQKAKVQEARAKAVPTSAPTVSEPRPSAQATSSGSSSSSKSKAFSAPFSKGKGKGKSKA